jgi:eukaryotic-like serine/threonine-protein kinase
MIARFLASLAGLLAALLVMNSLLMPMIVHHGREVEVPDVTKMKVSEAVAKLHAANLAVRDTMEQASSSIPLGVVIDQHPRAKLHVKPERGVLLVVSHGGTATKVPELGGQTLRFARLALTGAGYTLGDVLRVSSDKVDRNFVIASDPPSGETLPPGATVHLLVSDGPERTALVMPDLTGKDLDLTADRLNAAGFVVLVQRGNGLWDENRVKTALPAAGAMVAEGDTIRLFGR